MLDQIYDLFDAGVVLRIELIIITLASVEKNNFVNFT
jgi:hypothetical protein